MAAQLKDPGQHPALHTVRADQFAKVLHSCKHPPKPSARLMEMIAKGKRVMQKG
jgi:hypothetical protein